MQITETSEIHLGSGLIGIGRKWGHIDSSVPPEQEVIDFLSFAKKLGIFYFDTAASYAKSEARLGMYLSLLSQKERQEIVVSTKFGDHWDTIKNEAYVDHSYNVLKKSFDNSLSLLKQIDLLYLHKAHMQALQSKDVAKAFAYARSQGVNTFGASVSDLESAEYVLQNDFYSVMQFPYNLVNTKFSAIIDEATKRGKIIVINRPFNMGAMLYEKNKKDTSDKVKAFEFILKKQFNGFILTGTKSLEHLKENYKAFTQAKEQKSQYEKP